MCVPTLAAAGDLERRRAALGGVDTEGEGEDDADRRPGRAADDEGALESSRDLAGDRTRLVAVCSCSIHMPSNR